VEVTIYTEERGVGISYGESGTYMQRMNAEEFPKIDFTIGENSFVIKQNALKKIIAETVFCCAQDDSRPVLKGCLLQLNENLEITALDGYRLAYSETEIESKSGELSIICPARALNEISRMLSDEDETITVYTQGGVLLVKNDDMIVVSRLYTGDFIKKENVVPADFSTEVIISKEELCESTERAAILIRGDKNNIITLDMRNGTVKITSASDFGNVAETLRADIDGKELTISMNAKYLLDSLKAMEEEEVVLRFNGPFSPFTLQNKENKHNLYLILPVRNAS
jgi:DNA polymerase-3 subunit beta